MISKWWNRKWDWKKPGIDIKTARSAQRSFEIDFFESVLRRQSDYWEVLAILGNHYTAQKRYREGLAVDRSLAKLRPNDPIVFYNLACSYSLVGLVQSALKALERAMSLGYRDFRHMMRDADLAAVRKSGAFRRLVDGYAKT